MGDQGDELRAEAEQSLERKRSFRIHLRVYVLVNLLLWVIWGVLVATTELWVPWPLLPLLGWGIGLYFHWRAAYRPPRGPSEAEIAQEMERLKTR